MIHIAFKKATIAYRYYQLKYPERNYSPEQARKQFEQDRHKDVAIIGRIVDEIYKEQKKMLNKYDKTLAL